MKSLPVGGQRLSNVLVVSAPWHGGIFVVGAIVVPSFAFLVGAAGMLTGFLVFGVLVGDVVGRTGLAVGRTGAAVGGTGAAVGRTGAAVGRTGLAVGRTGLAVVRTGLAVGTLVTGLTMASLTDFAVDSSRTALFVWDALAEFIPE